MAISEFEIKKAERALDKFLAVHRPPVHIRPRLDICYRIQDQSVVIFEVTPSFRDPNLKTETLAAKATYVKSDKIWKIYWFKSDMKWHRYDPVPEVKTLEELLAVVGEDEMSCFFS